MPRGESSSVVDAAAVLEALHGAAAIDYSFPALAGTSSDHLDDVLVDLEHERRTRGELDRASAAERSLRSACVLFERLCATAPETVVLHGDFLTKNVLADGRTFKVIDPLPHRGDPSADVGAYASDQPVEAILDTATDLARHLGVDVQRSLSWAVVWTVMVTAQAWRSDQTELDALVASSTMQKALRAQP